MEINEKKVKEEIDIGKVNISKENKIKIEIKYLFFIKKVYYINTLPENFPEYEVSGESKYEGDYYIATYNNLEAPYYLFKVDEKGNIIYYKNTINATLDFKKQIINNDTIYTYLEIVTGEMESNNNSYYPTKMVMMNERYEVIDEIRYLNTDGTTQPLENHGALVLGENHYILATYKEVTVDNIQTDIIKTKNQVTNNLIEEVKDGKVLWQFQTIDYPELYEYCTEPSVLGMKDGYAPYAHYNSCTIDKIDGNLLCSFRNIDAIIKIDRKTGELIWILGGKGDQFGLTEQQKFAKQHAVTTLEDNSILIFNNENNQEISSIVKIKLDEVNKKVIEYEKIRLDAFSNFMGSAQLIEESGNTYVICYGGGIFRKPILEELNVETGNTEFSLDLKNSKFVYRIYKIK